MAATIYFAGSEEIDFINVGSFGEISSDDDSNKIRSNWVRAGVALPVGINGANFPSSPGLAVFAKSPTFTPVSDFWFHAQFYMLNNVTDSSYNVVGFGSSDNVWRLSLQATGNAGEWKLVKRDSSGILTNLATSDLGVFSGSGLSGDGRIQIDIHVEYGTRIQVFKNGSNTPSISYVGDARTDGETELNQFFLGRARFGFPVTWSEVIISDQNTRPMGLKSFPPDASGVNQDWDGSENDINEIVLDDDTFISTRVVNEVAEFVLPTAILGGRYDVEAVWSNVRISGGLTGPTNFEFVARPALSGGDFFSSDILVSAVLENYSYVWNQNPDTSSDWLTSDLETGFNLGIKAIT